MAPIPKLAMIPSGYKAGKVYSVLPTDGIGDFDFTRASSATRVNASGLIETVATGVPRLEYSLLNGVVNDCPSLLLEPQSTNLLQYSESFDNAYWNKAGSSVVGGFTSPKGDLSAFKLIEDSSIGGHFMYRSITSTTVGNDYTASICVKKGERDYFVLGTQTSKDAYFNLSTGVIKSSNNYLSSKITDLSNGYYICSITWVATSTSESIYMYNSADGITRNYQGDGTSGVYIFGAQLEQNSYPTSYIPTSGSAVTRVADVSDVSGVSSLIGQTEGTVFLDFKPQTLDSTSRYLSIENSSSIGSGWMGVFAVLVSGNIRFRFYGDGWDFNSTLIVEKNTRYKVAFSYKNGVQTSSYINGNLISNLTAVLSGQSFQKIRLSEAALGNRGDANFNAIQLYNTALTDAELTTLTTL
jgi:hypothetical protein